MPNDTCIRSSSSFLSFSLLEQMSVVKEEQPYVNEKIEKADVTSLELAQQSEDGFVEPSAEEMKALIWKLDLRLIPFLGLLYLCSFLDRVNIGKYHYVISSLLAAACSYFSIRKRKACRVDYIHQHIG